MEPSELGLLYQLRIISIFCLSHIDIVGLSIFPVGKEPLSTSHGLLLTELPKLAWYTLREKNTQDLSKLLFCLELLQKGSNTPLTTCT